MGGSETARAQERTVVSVRPFRRTETETRPSPDHQRRRRTPKSRQTTLASPQPFVPQKDDPIPKRSRLDEPERDPLLRRRKQAVPLSDPDRMDVDPVFVDEFLRHERRS